jgi:hypothetical protein
MEKPENMIPSHKPFAPMLSAYIGKKGTMMPTPRTEVEIAIERITKVSLSFTNVFLPTSAYLSIEFLSALLHPHHLDCFSVQCYTLLISETPINLGSPSMISGDIVCRWEYYVVFFHM